MWLDRVGDNLFSWMRTFAVLCLAIAGVAAWTGGWTLAAPPLRAGLLMGLAGWAPALVVAGFQARQRWWVARVGNKD